jgi:hypothetical protein
LTNGDYAAMGQLTFTPGRNLQVAFNYNHGYFSRGNFGFDNGLSNGPGSIGGFTGTGVANSLNGLSEGFDLTASALAKLSPTPTVLRLRCG